MVQYKFHRFKSAYNTHTQIGQQLPPTVSTNQHKNIHVIKVNVKRPTAHHVAV